MNGKPSEFMQRWFLTTVYIACILTVTLVVSLVQSL